LHTKYKNKYVVHGIKTSSLTSSHAYIIFIYATAWKLAAYIIFIYATAWKLAAYIIFIYATAWKLAAYIIFIYATAWKLAAYKEWWTRVKRGHRAREAPERQPPSAPSPLAGHGETSSLRYCYYGHWILVITVIVAKIPWTVVA
jgi:hypothetical protein